MNSIQSVSIMYLSAESLVNIYRDGKKPDYKRVGLVIEDVKFPLCRFVYERVVFYLGRTPSIFIENNSYNQDKKIIVDWFIENIINSYLLMGKSSSHLKIYFSETVAFLKWIEDTEDEFPLSISAAKKCFEKYTFFLKSSVRASKFQTRRAQIIQSIVLKLLKYTANDESNFIALNIPLFTSNFNSLGTPASTKEDQKKAFQFYSIIFREISKFLLSEKKSLLTFVWLGTKYYLHSTSNMRWIEVDSNNINSEGHHYDAPALASFCIKAYYMYFLSITGMNASVAGGLEWENNFLIEKKSYTFRGIKYRAGNKIVEYNIEKKFAQDFILFTKIRTIALDGNKNKYLFFDGYRKMIKQRIKFLSGSMPLFINSLMKTKVSKELPIINARQMRVNKMRHLLKTKDIKTASIMGQSSISTIIRHYTGDSEETSSIQLTNFFTSLNENIFNNNTEAQEISIGRCRKKFMPNTEVELKGIKIDCSQPEGCLFCAHYCFVPDDTDIRKLHSAVYVINESRVIAKNDDHFNEVFKPILERINTIFIIASINNNEIENLISAIKEDVFKRENLHPYWEHKLNLLVQLGVL